MPGTVMTIEIQNLEMLLSFLVCSQLQYSSSTDTSKVLKELFSLPWVIFSSLGLFQAHSAQTEDPSPLRPPQGGLASSFRNVAIKS